MIKRLPILAFVLIHALLVVTCGARTTVYKRVVPASAMWTSTDIEIPDNSEVRIEAVGAISPNGRKYVDANGSSDEEWNRRHNAYARIQHCALIARVGAGGLVHSIGNSGTLMVSTGGVLILGINDSDPTNNEGSLNVSVRVSPRPD